MFNTKKYDFDMLNQRITALDERIDELASSVSLRLKAVESTQGDDLESKLNSLHSTIIHICKTYDITIDVTSYCLGRYVNGKPKDHQVEINIIKY